MKTRKNLKVAVSKNNNKKGELNALAIVPSRTKPVLTRSEEEKVIATEIVKDELKAEIADHQALLLKKKEKQLNRRRVTMEKIEENLNYAGIDPHVEVPVDVNVKSLWNIFCPFFQLGDMILKTDATTIGTLWATFVNFMYQAFQGNPVGDVDKVPRELAMIYHAVSPRTVGKVNYSFSFAASPAYSPTAFNAGWYLTYANFNRAYGDNPVNVILPAAVTAPVAGSYIVDFNVFNLWFRERQAVFKLVSLKNKCVASDDASAYAWSSVNSRSYSGSWGYVVPGQIIANTAGTNGYFRDMSTQPGLEVPIKTRWLASLSLRFGTGAGTMRGFLRHFAECETPAVEIGHQLFCSMMDMPREVRMAVPKTVQFDVREIVQTVMAIIDKAVTINTVTPTVTCQMWASVLITVICRWFSAWSWMFPPFMCHDPNDANNVVVDNFSAYGNTVNKNPWTPQLPAYFSLWLSAVYPYFGRAPKAGKGFKDLDFFYYPCLMTRDADAPGVNAATNVYCDTARTWTTLGDSGNGIFGWSTWYSGGIAFAQYDLSPGTKSAGNCILETDMTAISDIVQQRTFPSTYADFNLTRVIRMRDYNSAQIKYAYNCRRDDPVVHFAEFLIPGSTSEDSPLNTLYSKTPFYLRYFAMKKAQGALTVDALYKGIAVLSVTKGGYTKGNQLYSLLERYDEKETHQAEVSNGEPQSVIGGLFSSAIQYGQEAFYEYAQKTYKHVVQHIAETGMDTLTSYIGNTVRSSLPMLTTLAGTAAVAGVGRNQRRIRNEL